MFDIVTYGGGGFITEILNGVAMIFGNGNYMVALKTAALIGFMVVLVAAAMTGRGVDVKWIITMIFIYMVVIVPKVSVNVIDRINKTAGAPTITVVGNVPVGLAIAAALTSNMSRLFTEMAETVYSLPNQLRFSESGPLFSLSMTEAASKFAIRDPNVQTSMANFWKDCVFYDLALARYTLKDVTTSTNVMAFLYDHGAINRGFQFIDPDGGQSVQICKDAVDPSTGVLFKSWDLEVQKGVKAIGLEKNNTAQWTGANEALISQAANMPIAFQYLTGLSATSTQILQQAALANSLQDGVMAFGAGSDAQAQVASYAAARANVERQAQYAVIAKITADMLPVMKNLIEGFLYAIFPIMGLWIILPNGYKAGLMYVKALVWIALWSPIYAILNFGVTYFAKIAATKSVLACGAGGGSWLAWNSATVCTQSYNMLTSTALHDVMMRHSSIAGFLMASIPMIAWMLVAGGGAMAAGLVGRVMDGYQQPAERAASEASAGNFNMGNTSMGNVTAFQGVTAPRNTEGFTQSDTGREVRTTTMGGGDISNIRGDSGMASASAGSNIQSAAQRQLSDSTRATESTQASLTQADINRFNTLTSAESSVGHSTGVGTAHGKDSSAGSNSTMSAVTDQAMSLARSNGVSETYMSAALAGAGLSLPGGVAKVGAEARNSDEYKKAEELAQRYTSSQQFRETVDKGEKAYFQDTTNNKSEAAVSGREAVSNARDQSVAAQEAHTAAVTKEKALQELVSDLKTNGASGNSDLTAGLRNAVESRGDKDWATYNVDLSGQNGQAAQAAAQRQLDSYVQNFANDYVQSRVNSSAGDIEAHGNASMQAIKDESAPAVAAANATGSSAVEKEKRSDHTTARDGRKIEQQADAKADAVDGKIAFVVNEQVNPAGDAIKKDVNTAMSAETVSVRVDEMSKTSASGRAATLAAENTADAIDTVAGAAARGMNSVGDAVQSVPVVGEAIGTVVGAAGNVGNVVSEAATGKDLREQGHDMGVDIAAQEGLSGVVDNNKPTWAKPGATEDKPNATAGNTDKDERPR